MQIMLTIYIYIYIWNLVDIYFTLIDNFYIQVKQIDSSVFRTTYYVPLTFLSENVSTVVTVFVPCGIL